jgi:hypothetical protein
MKVLFLINNVNHMSITVLTHLRPHLYAPYIVVCTPHLVWAGFTRALLPPWKSTSPLPMPYQPIVLTEDKK